MEKTKEKGIFNAFNLKKLIRAYNSRVEKVCGVDFTQPLPLF